MIRVITKTIGVSTKGHTHIIDLTDKLTGCVHDEKMTDGNLTVFVSGSTAGVTTIEYEPGLLKDLPEVFEQIAPVGKRYHHDDTWHDGNGYAHIRSSLLGPSLTVPFSQGKLLLGTWQQVVLIDFDNRPRKREVVVQMIGE
jgi:secondary thiamine-phosphate synthase enzyme